MLNPTLTLCLSLSGLIPLQDSNPARGETGWKVGLARVKITPHEPVRMSGYGSRTQPSQGVASDLFAKAMAIEDGDGHRAVLVTSDLIGFKADLAESICSRITEKTGLKRDQILLNSSHTHTGPVLSLRRANLDFPAEQAAATVRYTEWLRSRLVDLVAESLERLRPARLAWTTGVATFVMNRREFTKSGVKLGVNPRGLVDRSVPMLRIDSPEGKLLGVLFGAACHNTTLTGKDLKISGDFSGYAQVRIEQAHDGVQAMFIQGCAGDANPFPRGSEEIARLHGRSLGDEVLRLLRVDARPINGKLKTVLKRLDLPLAPLPEKARLEALGRSGGWRQFVARTIRAKLDAGEKIPTSYPAPIAVWQFGNDMTLVALPGEVVVDYVALIDDALGPRRLWIAAYSNDVFGYLPSAKVIRQGGYETRGLYAGGVGFFSPEAQDATIEAVRELAAEAGRPAELSAQP